MQQIGFAGGVPLLVLVVGFDGVAGFLYVSEWRNNGLAVEYGGDLFFTEDIAFNGEGSADREDAVDASQAQVLRDACCAANRFSDFFNAKENFRRDCVWWFFDFHCLYRVVDIAQEACINVLNHARLRHPSYCDLAVKTMWIAAQHHAAMTRAFHFTLLTSQ